MTRVGMGYDTHRFKEGRRLVLGGIEIESDRGLDGHSDADVLCHAIADAILGALGERDIGHYFPNTDPKLEGISSLQILREVRRIAVVRNAVIVNVDSTLVAEAPRISPYLLRMREAIAHALEIGESDVGIKATTNEKMGFVGREEGLAAFAVALVDKSAIQVPPGGEWA